MALQARKVSGAFDKGAPGFDLPKTIASVLFLLGLFVPLGKPIYLHEGSCVHYKKM